MPHRILIIEADAALRHLLADVVEDEGYAAITAATAESALGMLAQVRPHLMLCNLLLPGMDGVTFYARLLRLPRRPPMVFLTARCRRPAEARLLREAPACPIVTTPLDLTILMATIEATLDRSADASA